MSKGEFGASVPPETIIITEVDDHPIFVLSSQDVRIDITIRPNRGPSDSALAIRPAARNRGIETDFELGKVVGHVNVSERPDRYATVIYASSKKYSYFVAAYARVPEHPKVKRFLASLKFDGKPLMNIPGENSKVSATPQQLEDMPSSPIVKQFLKTRVNKKNEVRFEPLDPKIPVVIDQEPDLDVTDLTKVTRSLIILRNPKPAYRPSLSRSSGIITVVVTLLATGEVGTIIVDSKADRGMAEAAVDAARQIKFIPAEYEGRPIDVTRRFVYGYVGR